MTMRPLAVLLLGAALPLAACGDYRGLETAHQPVVAQTDYSTDLLAGPDGLAAGETQRLRGWLDVLGAAPGSTIALDDPAASPGTRADLTAIAAERGMRLAPVAVAQGAPLAPGMVRVVVTRTTASVPSCQPPAERASLVNFDAHTSSAFGCAVNTTLAAMIADPNDLVRGKSDDGMSSGATATKAVGAWRKAPPTGAGGTVVKSETTGGNR